MYYEWRDQIMSSRTVFCNPEADAYWLADQTGDAGLHQALISLKHSNARCATPGATHKAVLGILRSIARTNTTFGPIAATIALRYENTYCPLSSHPAATLSAG